MAESFLPTLSGLFDRLESQAGRAGRAAGKLAATLSPQADDCESHRLRALMHLARGEFARGWQELCKHDAAERVLEDASKTPPAWDGRLDASTRLILKKQGGIGEQVLLASCLGQAQLRDARLLVECDAALRPLLERSFPCFQFESELTTAMPGFLARWADARQGSLIDLAAAARPARKAFPPRNRFLAPCPRLRRAARAWLDWLGGEFKIGVGFLSARAVRCHQSGAELNATLMRVCDQLADLPGVSLVDLTTATPVYASPRGRGETSLAKAFPVGESLSRDLDARAALMAELDLVVTPANVNAHLCGAVGGRGWIVVPWLPKWCWMSEGEQTPWYPELTLFRPARPDDWEDVAARLIARASHLRQRRKPFTGSTRTRIAAMSRPAR